MSKMQAENFNLNSYQEDKRSVFHSRVLCLSLLATVAISADYYFWIYVLLLLCHVVLFGSRVDRATIRVISPFVFMCLFGFCFVWGNEFHDSLRDLWFISKVIVCFLVGYFLGKRITRPNYFLNLFARTCLLLSAVYLFRFVTTIQQMGVEYIGRVEGFTLVVVLAVPLLVFRRPGFQYRGSSLLKYGIVLSVVLGAVLSVSRTAMGSIGILMLVAAGFFSRIKRMVAVVVLLCAGLFLAAQFIPADIDTEVISFKKIGNSFSEILFVDETDMKAVLVNWRGFESYRAYLAFQNASLTQKIVGRGWGAVVDLGQNFELNRENYRYIPVMHNGYMYILTKFGLLGIVSYVVFLWRITVESRRHFLREGHLTYAWLATGIGLILSYTTLVISGVFNKVALDAVVIMLGFVYGSYALRRQGRHLRFARRPSVFSARFQLMRRFSNVTRVHPLSRKGNGVPSVRASTTSDPDRLP